MIMFTKSKKAEVGHIEYNTRELNIVFVHIQVLCLLPCQKSFHIVIVYFFFYCCYLMVRCLKYCKKHLLSMLRVKVSFTPTLALPNCFANYNFIADIVHWPPQIPQVAQSMMYLYSFTSSTTTLSLLVLVHILIKGIMGGIVA